MGGNAYLGRRTDILDQQARTQRNGGSAECKQSDEKEKHKPDKGDDFYFFFQVLLSKALTGIFIPRAGKANIGIGQKDVSRNADNVNAIDRRIVGKAWNDNEHRGKV